MDIEQALGVLPVDQRAAIVLVDVEGYSVTDAALALGVAEGTIKSRCARGRAKLAVLLGHLRNPDGPRRVGSSDGASTTAGNDARFPADPDGPSKTGGTATT